MLDVILGPNHALLFGTKAKEHHRAAGFDGALGHSLCNSHYDCNCRSIITSSGHNFIAATEMVKMPAQNDHLFLENRIRSLKNADYVIANTFRVVLGNIFYGEGLTSRKRLRL